MECTITATGVLTHEFIGVGAAAAGRPIFLK